MAGATARMAPLRPMPAGSPPKFQDRAEAAPVTRRTTGMGPVAHFVRGFCARFGAWSTPAEVRVTVYSRRARSAWTAPSQDALDDALDDTDEGRRGTDARLRMSGTTARMASTPRRAAGTRSVVQRADADVVSMAEFLPGVGVTGESAKSPPIGSRPFAAAGCAVHSVVLQSVADPPVFHRPATPRARHERRNPSHPAPQVTGRGGLPRARRTHAARLRRTPANRPRPASPRAAGSHPEHHRAGERGVSQAGRGRPHRLAV